MKIFKFLFSKEVIYPIIIIFFAFIIYIFAKKFTKQIFNVKAKKIDIKKKNTVCSLIINIEKYFFIIISILMILSVYGVDTVTLVTSLGVVGIAVGLAVQDTLKDFISGISIIFENQYCVGDTITVNDFKGEVIELGMKTTKIKSYKGDVLIIPNHLIEKVINHSVDKSLAVVDVDISYEADLDRVEEILEKLCKDLTKRLPNLKGEVRLLGINELGSSSVKYNIVADTEPTENLSVERMIRKELKIILDKNKIQIPYNQVVVHNAK